jgi:hypothetical protein
LVSTLGRKRVGAATLVVLGAVFVLTCGHRNVTNAKVLTEAAGWLEQRCAKTGCLTNVLPAQIRARVWQSLERGASLEAIRATPRAERLKRDFIAGLPPAKRRLCRFDQRVRRAQAAGFTGPVFHVELAVKSLRLHSIFDTERLCQGKNLPPAGWKVVATLAHGDDRIVIRRPPAAPVAGQP